ncbi:hemagglutinin, partial [Fusobacterium periodonticum ATCC 33693]
NVDGTSASTLVKSGEEVVFKAGDNLVVKQDLSTGKQEYTYKLNKDLTGLDSVTSKKLTVPGTGGKDTVIDSNGINAGGNKITNVAPGVVGTDAVNVSQLTKLATNTIQLGGDNASVTATQQLDKTGGIKFNIVGENGITTKAAGDKVTIGVDTNTIGANIKLKYKSNSDATTAQEVKLSDGLNFKDGKFTTASVGANGEVKYDTVTQGITVTDGKATVPTTDGLTTAKDIANVVNNLGWK